MAFVLFIVGCRHDGSMLHIKGFQTENQMNLGACGSFSLADGPGHLPVQTDFHPSLNSDEPITSVYLI